MDNPLSYALVAKSPVGCRIEEFVQDTLTSLNTGQQGKQNQVPVAEKPLESRFTLNLSNTTFALFFGDREGPVHIYKLRRFVLNKAVDVMRG